MDSSVYYITMLGEFTITYKNRNVTEQSNRSKKLWNMLAYLIYNRRRPVSQEELIKLIWHGDGENTAGALKVLIHRVRKNLEPISIGPDTELVHIKKGEYFWGPLDSTKVDVDRFEDLCKRSEAEDLTDEDRLDLLRDAVALYKGRFLQRNGSSWIVALADYYDKLYMDAVSRLLALLKAKGAYKEITQICRKAIAIDGATDKLCFYLIEALYMSGQKNEAMREYSEVTNLFYKQYGITPSDELKSLYRTIQASVANATENDINTVKEALKEKEGSTGAFYCEFEFFKDIYRLEERACARSGDSIFLCLITLGPTSDDEIAVKYMNKAMEDAKGAIAEALRRGDVFSRYSVNQYVILLPTATFENVDMIMKRIMSAYGRKHTKKDVAMTYKMQPLDPC